MLMLQNHHMMTRVARKHSGYVRVRRMMKQGGKMTYIIGLLQLMWRMMTQRRQPSTHGHKHMYLHQHERMQPLHSQTLLISCGHPGKKDADTKVQVLMMLPGLSLKG